MSGSRPCGPPARSALSRTAFATAGTSGRSTPSERAAAAHSPRSPRRRLSRRWPRCPGDAACDCRGRSWPPPRMRRAICGYCSSQVPTASTVTRAPARSASASSSSAIDAGPCPWKVSAARARSRGPCTTCGPSCTWALPGRLTAGDGAAGADPGRLLPGDTPPRRVLVHPARPTRWRPHRQGARIPVARWTRPEDYSLSASPAAPILPPTSALEPAKKLCHRA